MIDSPPANKKVRREKKGREKKGREKKGKEKKGKGKGKARTDGKKRKRSEKQSGK